MSKESSPIKVLQSVESFANYLRDQFISSTPAVKVGVASYMANVYICLRLLLLPFSSCCCKTFKVDTV